MELSRELQKLWPGQVTVISWEILEHAVKVAKKNLPHATHRGDLLLETDVTIEELLRELPDVKKVSWQPVFRVKTTVTSRKAKWASEEKSPNS